MTAGPAGRADASGLSLARIIELLALVPHPEGGYYRETFRDGSPAAPTAPEAPTGSDASRRPRALSTAIYFLLPAGVVSRWHRVDAAEVWHWYAGAPLSLTFGVRRQALTRVTLGPDLERGERPQAVVPAGHWQQAISLGDWTLAGCTVAPGFEFAGFEMLEANEPPP